MEGKPFKPVKVKNVKTENNILVIAVCCSLEGQPTKPVKEKYVSTRGRKTIVKKPVKTNT